MNILLHNFYLINVSKCFISKHFFMLLSSLSPARKDTNAQTWLQASGAQWLQHLLPGSQCTRQSMNTVYVIIHDFLYKCKIYRGHVWSGENGRVGRKRPVQTGRTGTGAVQSEPTAPGGTQGGRDRTTWKPAARPRGPAPGR